MDHPSANGPDGPRDASGRFAKGNPGGPGNPHAARVAVLRSALLNAVTEGDIVAVVESLVAEAKTGNTAAAREVLLRVLGKPESFDLLERLEAIEQRLAESSLRRTA